MSEELLNEILRNANRNNLFRSIVDGARDRGSMLEVHADRRNLDAGRIGFVLESGDDGFSFQELDDEGEPDGVVTLSFRSIIELRERSREICRLQALHRAATEEHLAHSEDDASYSNAGVIRSRLESAQASRALIEVRIESDNDVRHIRGFVASVSRDFVQLNVVTFNGDPDGVATVKLNDVSTIFEDDWEIRRARKLYENRAGLYDSAEFESLPPSQLS